MELLVNNKKMLDKLKLIIWDLDDTFWTGTLSEQDYVLEDERLKNNIELIKNLSEKGIINSICSKNDRDEVENCLTKLGIRDYFVFISVNWEAKGQRIKKMISDMSLRAENVLFIDDNESNLSEVKFYNPDIMVAGPNVVDFIAENIQTLGKNDKELTRLKQYQLLEKKETIKEKFDNNLSFLEQSDIKVFIGKDCLSEIERIHELILRTNQLNYTKNRMERSELERILKDERINSGYVVVSDKYGEYGICGFFAVLNEECIHFVFSCRIMGMGVEQFVYHQIGTPRLSIVEPVAGKVDINEECPHYISRIYEWKKPVQTEIQNNKKILIKGPCDLQVMTSFLKEKNFIQEEFNYTDDSGQQVDFYNHTVQILNSRLCDDETKSRLTEKYSFIPKSSFETNIFEKPWDVVCLSVLMDATLGVYQHINGNVKIPFGLYHADITDKDNWDSYVGKHVMTARSNFTEEELHSFSSEFVKINYTAKDIVGNLQEIYQLLLKNNPNVICVIVLLSELKYENKLENKNVIEGKEKFHSEINKCVRETFNGYSNIVLLDVNKYVKTQNDYFDNINHYSNLVYYNMAQELADVMKNSVEDDYQMMSKFGVWYSNFKKMIVKKLFLKKYLKKIY